jgi:hypothetical protein
MDIAIDPGRHHGRSLVIVVLAAASRRTPNVPLTATERKVWAAEQGYDWTVVRRKSSVNLSPLLFGQNRGVFRERQGDVGLEWEQGSGKIGNNEKQ